MPTYDATPRDCHWEVDDLRLTGLAWGPADGRPVLALHGWMDHAGSFQTLAPILTGCHVVALELSGQGHSARRAPHATYNIWDDLPQIAEVLDRLGWRACVLLGHSRGANISTLFAAALPERVRALVALDALVPEPVADEEVVNTLRNFIEQTRKQKARAPRTFASVAEYVDRRRQQGNSPTTSQALAGRALEQAPDGFRMRGDPRHFASSAVKLTRAQIEALLGAVQCPVLNIWAAEGITHTRPEARILGELGSANIRTYETRVIPGDHHFHLDPAAAGNVAAAILDFLARHDPAADPRT